MGIVNKDFLSEQQKNMEEYLKVHRGTDSQSGLPFADQVHFPEDEGEITPQEVKQAYLSFCLTAEVLDQLENDLDLQKKALEGCRNGGMYYIPLNLKHHPREYALTSYHVPISKGPFVGWFLQYTGCQFNSFGAEEKEVITDITVTPVRFITTLTSKIITDLLFIRHILPLLDGNDWIPEVKRFHRFIQYFGDEELKSRLAAVSS